MAGWIVYALLSAASAGLVAIFGKVGIKDVDSTLATTVRAVIMAGILLVTALVLGKVKYLSSIDNKALLFIALSGVAGAFSWLMYFVALRTGPASGVAAVDRLSVVFVLVFAVLFLAEQLTWRTAVGGALITVGAILMTLR